MSDRAFYLTVRRDARVWGWSGAYRVYWLIKNGHRETVVNAMVWGAL